MNIAISNVSDFFKLAKECFGVGDLKKKKISQDLHIQNNWCRFSSHIIPYFFIAHKIQLIKPVPGFLSVTGGREAHRIPCSVHPLEHVTEKCHSLGPFLQSAPTLTTFSTCFGYKKRCNPLDRGSVAYDPRHAFGMAQLYNLVSSLLRKLLNAKLCESS